MSPSGSPTAGIAANVTAAAAGDVSGGAAAQQQVQMSGVVALVVCVLAMIGVF